MPEDRLGLLYRTSRTMLRETGTRLDGGMIITREDIYENAGRDSMVCKSSRNRNAGVAPAAHRTTQKSENPSQSCGRKVRVLDLEIVSQTRQKSTPGMPRRLPGATENFHDFL